VIPLLRAHPRHAAALAVAFAGAALLILATSLGAHAAGLIIAGVGLHCAGATASQAGA